MKLDLQRARVKCKSQPESFARVGAKRIKRPVIPAEDRQGAVSRMFRHLALTRSVLDRCSDETRPERVRAIALRIESDQTRGKFDRRVNSLRVQPLQSDRTIRNLGEQWAWPIAADREPSFERAHGACFIVRAVRDGQQASSSPLILLFPSHKHLDTTVVLLDVCDIEQRNITPSQRCGEAEQEDRSIASDDGRRTAQLVDHRPKLVRAQWRTLIESFAAKAPGTVQQTVDPSYTGRGMVSVEMEKTDRAEVARHCCNSVSAIQPVEEISYYRLLGGGQGLVLCVSAPGGERFPIRAVAGGTDGREGAGLLQAFFRQKLGTYRIGHFGTRKFSHVPKCTYDALGLVARVSAFFGELHGNIVIHRL
jgi:hypothetical protein